jgi:uracil-DNA glycosylase
MVRFQNSWDEILKDEFDKDYYKNLINFLKIEYANYTIYPEKDNVMNSLKCTDYNDVKVCIVGQDPYHGKGQAHGMAFSVNPDIKIPPSLVNIYKELNDDLGLYIPNNGYLMKWAKEGVLLLNTSLTVRSGSPASHSGKGWEIFTDGVISKLNEREKPVVFLLWGNHARSKKALVTKSQHKILEAAHPSPFSAYSGFFGCKHFSKTNEFLKSIGSKEIDWQIENI